MSEFVNCMSKTLPRHIVVHCLATVRKDYFLWVMQSEHEGNRSTIYILLQAVPPRGQPKIEKLAQ